MNKNDVVQFNETHKWCGCLGIVEDFRNGQIKVGVSAPIIGTTYIFAKKSELEHIGIAALIPKN